MSRLHRFHGPHRLPGLHGPLCSVIVVAGLVGCTESSVQSAGGASAGDANASVAVEGKVVVQGAWARVIVDPGALYLVLVNGSRTADRLLSISSPIARAVELHETFERDGVVKMRSRAEGVELPAGATVRLAPGGLHAMLMGLSVDAGAISVPVVLELENAGPIEVSAEIRELPPP